MYSSPIHSHKNFTVIFDRPGTSIQFVWSHLCCDKKGRETDDPVENTLSGEHQAPGRERRRDASPWCVLCSQEDVSPQLEPTSAASGGGVRVLKAGTLPA